MDLLIDFGNSLLKWCLWVDERVVDQGHIDPAALESGLRSIDWSVVQSVAICSVSDPELTHAVAVYCDSFSEPYCDILERHIEHLPNWFCLGSTSVD